MLSSLCLAAGISSALGCLTWLVLAWLPFLGNADRAVSGRSLYLAQSPIRAGSCPTLLDGLSGDSQDLSGDGGFICFQQLFITYMPSSALSSPPTG